MDCSLFEDIVRTYIPLGAWFALGGAVFLLIASGYISSNEVAFFSLKPDDLDKIKEREHPTDESLLNLLEHPERLLATILIANNLINVAIVVLMSYSFNLIFDFSSNPALGFTLQTIVLTFLLLLFGEIIPKVYAQGQPLKLCRFSSPTMSVLHSLLRPLAILLMNSTRVITKRMEHKRYNTSMDELSQAVDLLADKQTEEKQIFEEIISFYSKTASEVMVARIDMVDINYEWDYHRMLHFALECGYSRIPVYEGSEDNIKGLIYIRDFIKHRNAPADFDWHSIIRPTLFIPENKPLDSLLEELREKKIHMAIVVDEYGGTSGLITMEDIIEEIVGDISDEYDVEALPYKLMPDGSYLFEAKTPIGDVHRYLELEDGAFGPYEDYVDTLGGLFLEIKQDLPLLGDKVEAGQWVLTVKSLERFRIISILLAPK